MNVDEDIKPDNILLDLNEDTTAVADVKLADRGKRHQNFQNSSEVSS
jgi:serine/threonine protein kinase